MSETGFTEQVSRDLQLQLKDYRLTLAEILYRLPDHPALLQSYIWQEYDIAPKFPVLRKFLEFWETKLDGKLHSVRVSSTSLIQPPRHRFATAQFALH